MAALDGLLTGLALALKGACVVLENGAERLLARAVDGFEGGNSTAGWRGKTSSTRSAQEAPQAHAWREYGLLLHSENEEERERGRGSSRRDDGRGGYLVSELRLSKPMASAVAWGRFTAGRPPPTR
eukprot:3938392-Rhodomonas_salina.1